ncbi:hypothetical protein SFRURICE_016906 [Spodoptera frugiperda]|nr:hypothetical protein SFRURICE_016906 [Spodoptera frugiperda]
MPTSHNFKILHQNIASVLSKQELIELTLQEMRDLQNDPHIICFSETFIKKGYENYLKLSDYDMATYFCREKNRGGTCILVKKGISFRELAFVKKYASENTFEACGIELALEKLNTSVRPSLFLTKLDSMLQHLYKKYKSKTRIVLTGDFNINTLKKGKITQEFQDLAHTHNLKIHINVATRKYSCIDHILSNIHQASANVLPLHLSDHETAQMLSFPLQIQSRETIYYIYKRDYSINNTLKFKECLQNLFWTDVYMDNDANTAFNSFHDLICLFYNLCFPKVRVKINTNNKIKQTWITKGLKLSSKTKPEITSAFNNHFINCIPTQNQINSCLNENVIANSMFLTPITEHNRAFIAQKKCIRAIYGIPPDESCKPIFKKLGLLPLPSLYIYEMCMFVKKHQDLFKTAEEVCSRSRRDQYTLVLDELPRCTKYNKNCIAMCVRVYNNLPKTLKELNCRLFKFKLYKWLNENNFYSIKEYLVY